MDFETTTKLCIDLRQFFSNPIRTGVQRVIKELLANWNTSDFPFELKILAQIEEDLYWLSKDQAIELMGSIFGLDGNTFEPISHKLTNNFTKTAWPICLLEVDKWLIPEPSLNLDLIRSWEIINDSMPTVFIFYDCLPIKYPQYFDQNSVIQFSNYVRLISRAGSVITISDASKKDLFELIPKKSSNKVLVSHLSGKHQTRNVKIDFAKQRVIVLSTIEKRKNISIVINAFEEISKKYPEAELVVCGKAGNDLETLNYFNQSNNRVSWIDNPTDQYLNELLLNSSVLISIGLEGFGLPVLEALELGVPVIVAESQPVTEVLSQTGGVITISKPCVEEVLDSLSHALEPKLNQSLRRSIDTANLPDWSSFVNSVASVCLEASFEV